MLERSGGGAVLALAMAAGLFKPGSAWAQAWNKAAFEVKTLNDAVKAMGGAPPTESKEIAMTAPDIAESGAEVPLTIESHIPNTQSIAVLVEKNPNILAARFDLPAGTQPWINTHVKMAQTSNVYAVVKTTDGRFYSTSKEIKVTLGGCGG